MFPRTAVLASLLQAGLVKEVAVSATWPASSYEADESNYSVGLDHEFNYTHVVPSVWLVEWALVSISEDVYFLIPLSI